MPTFFSETLFYLIRIFRVTRQNLQMHLNPDVIPFQDISYKLGILLCVTLEHPVFPPFLL